MRYDTPIYFCRQERGVYNQSTGNWEQSEPTEEKVYASVQPTRERTAQMVYGTIKEGSLTASIQNHYEQAFDYIRIGEAKYEVDYRRTLRVKEAFVIHEVT